MMNHPHNPDLHEGILLIDKDKGHTSFTLVQSLRRLLNVKKIGHSGTLDPFATGVMVMLVGRKFTRLSDHFLNHDKEYLAQLYLGMTTDSYDSDGKPTGQCDRIPTLEEIQHALHSFQGEVDQIPPMFSAKKVKGKKLYELARKGIEIERAPVKVKLDTQFISYAYPYLELKVTCSKGTYIRSLANDLGNMLECGAHLTQLRRTRSGPFHIENCISESDLRTLNEEQFIKNEFI